MNLALSVVLGFLMLESTMAPMPAPMPAPRTVPAIIDPVALRARISWMSVLRKEIERSTPPCLL